MKLLLIMLGVVILLLISGLVLLQILQARQPINIDELWNMQYDGTKLEGKTVVIRGDIVFDPHSDFRFNALYLVDFQTPSEYLEPSYAFWFGIKIDGFSCEASDISTIWICQPFEPNQAKSFEFKGTIHLTQVGKRPIMWLSDIDYERSRQLVDGMWQSIPLGQFEISLGEQE